MSALSFVISATTAALSAVLLLNFAVVGAELLLVTGLLVWDATGVAVAFILVAGVCDERKASAPYVSEREWKGCVFPRRRAPQERAREDAQPLFQT